MRLNQQRGISLISLMVGTVLSMLTIIAMLALYKNLVQVAVDATQDANHDGGLASALLVAQLELQGAGFGMDKTFNETVSLRKLLPEPEQPQQYNAILWKYKNLDTVDTSCSGLLVRKHPKKTERDYRTLTLLHKPICNVALSSLSVDELDSILEVSWGTDLRSITNLATLAPESTLAFKEKSYANDDDKKCGNYGSGNEKHPQIVITAMSSSALANSAGDGLRIRYTVCLSNIRS